MYRPIIFFIGLRYLFSASTSNKSARFISYISIIGITLGVTTLITILSVMNGFEQDLQKKILKFMPQAIISSVDNFLNEKKVPKNIFLKLKGINNITPITIGYVILQNNHNLVLATMLGIDPMQHDPLFPYLINTNEKMLIPDQYNVILGAQLAKKLEVNYNDKIRILSSSINYFTPIGKIPNQRLFNFIGIFNTDSEADWLYILVNIKDASKLMKYPVNNITGWRLWLNEPLKIDKLIQQILPKDLKWNDWREIKGELFQAIKMEKNIMGLLLSLIIIISSFNIINSLGIFIVKRKHEIAILQTYGFTSQQVMFIFIIQGISVGIIGSSLGIIIGIILVSQLNKLSLIIDMPAINNIILSVHIDVLQIIIITVFTIITSLCATIYPAWYATKVSPIEILKYE